MTDTPRLTDKSLRVLKIMLEKPLAGRAGAELSRITGIGSGTLYPLLARFEAAGWLSSEWETSTPSNLGRPRQRFYRLTGAGQSQALHALSNLRVSEEALAWAR